jgi:release factor glutamine methyltransferase
MRLLTLPGVFRPHSDSWMLARHISREPLDARSRVLDLCTGSGLLAIAAARRGASEVVAVDVSRRAAITVRINARLNGVSVTAKRGDLFDAVGDARFDLIVSNPPYLPCPDGQLPRRGPSRAWEAGVLGRAFIDRICAEAPAHLSPEGRLLLTHSSVCGERETLDALTRNGLNATVTERRLGPLGPRLHARSRWLRERGLLTTDGLEEILIIRAHASAIPARAHLHPLHAEVTRDG